MRNGPLNGDGRPSVGGAKPRKEPEDIRTILDRWLRRNRAAEKAAEGGIYRDWKEIVGGEIAAQTRVVKCSGGVLTVEVASAPLLQELSGFYREEILESIRARPEHRGVHEIRFRAGTVSGAGSFGKERLEGRRKERRIGKEPEEHKREEQGPGEHRRDAEVDGSIQGS